MKLENATPVAAAVFRQFDAAGGLDCVVAARATFRHRQDGHAVFHQAQEPFAWSDQYEGDPQHTPLLRQTDLTPEKPGTDVTFLGSSYAPLGAGGAWSCRLAIGPIDKTLYVSGRRSWQPVRRQGLNRVLSRKGPIADWSLSPPEHVGEVPIDWRLAYGGAIPGSDAHGPPEVDERNPIGTGILPPDAASIDAEHPVPQILSAPPRALGEAQEPAGFGPVPPAWQQRRRHAGTYDDVWSATRHPLLPEDFDPRFWQAAPPDQVAMPHLVSGETYTLENLHPEHAVATGRLPVVTLAVHCAPGGRAGGDGQWHVMALDGVQFDWRDDDRILLTWRARFPLPDAATAVLRLDRVKRVAPPAPQPAEATA